MWVSRHTSYSFDPGPLKSSTASIHINSGRAPADSNTVVVGKWPV